jgi:hypothetical protein
VPVGQWTLFRQRIGEVEFRPRLYERDSLTVERDGRVERYAATVVEREFLPPAGGGGKPFIRRLLIAWKADRAFTMSSNDSVADVVHLPRWTFARPWARVGAVAEHADDGQSSWFGTSGEIRFVAGPATTSCAVRDSVARTRVDVGDNLEDLSGYDDCVRRRYRVSLTAELARDEQGKPPGLLARWLGRSASIRIPEQELPGMHIVERCDDKPWPKLNCHPFNFWRAQSQFAKALPADVPFELARVTPVVRQPNVLGPFQQTITAGTGDSITYCCRAYAGPIEYTIYTLDGGAPRHAKFASALDDTLMDNVVGLASLRHGSRTLFYLPSLLRRSSPAIVDLKLLPSARDAGNR